MRDIVERLQQAANAALANAGVTLELVAEQERPGARSRVLHRAAHNRRRAAGAKGGELMATWEYLTWTTTDTKAGRSIREVNGEPLEEYQRESPALVEVGQQGWELVSVVVSGAKNGHMLYFKRLLSESVHDRVQERRSDDDAIADAWADQTALRPPVEEGS
jgi:hypothetical protein